MELTVMNIPVVTKMAGEIAVKMLKSLDSIVANIEFTNVLNNKQNENRIRSLPILQKIYRKRIYCIGAQKVVQKRIAGSQRDTLRNKTKNV